LLHHGGMALSESVRTKLEDVKGVALPLRLHAVLPAGRL